MNQFKGDDEGLVTDIKDIAELIHKLHLLTDVEIVLKEKFKAQQALTASIKDKEWGEKLFNQTMEAKKSGWDDAVKFYEAERLDRPDREKIAKLEYESRHPRGRKWKDAGDTGGWKIECYGIADKILALIPDYRQEIGEFIGEIEKEFLHKASGRFLMTNGDKWQALKSKYGDNPLP